MKSLLIHTTAGVPLEVQVEDGSAALLADEVNRQNPALALITEDGSVLFLNTRHVVAWTVEDMEEPAAEDPDVSPSDSAEDTRTVAELKAALDEKGIDYPSSALKADLQELAQTNNV